MHIGDIVAITSRTERYRGHGARPVITIVTRNAKLPDDICPNVLQSELAAQASRRPDILEQARHDVRQEPSGWHSTLPRYELSIIS